MLNEIDLVQKVICLGDAVKKKNKKWSETSLNEYLFQGIVLIPRQKTKKILTERHLLDLEAGI